MRLQILVASVLFLCAPLPACGSGDEKPTNTEATATFRDGLSAEDILESIRQADEEFPDTARIRTTSVSHFGGRPDRDTTEMIVVGDDYYGVRYNDDDPPSEFLYYDARFYTRDDPDEAWVTVPEYEGAANVLTSVKQELEQSIEPEALQSEASVHRLADESIEGRKSYQIAIRMKDVDLDPRSYSEAISSGLEEEFGKEIPTIPADYFPPDVSFEIRFWYAVSDLTFTRYEVRLTAGQGDEEEEIMRRTMEVLDRNQPLTLPGPLPTD